MLGTHRTAHRWIWTMLALAIPVFLAFALSRPVVVAGAPVQLSPAPEAPR